MRVLWRFSVGETGFAIDGGRVTVDPASVTCNE